MSRFFKLIPGMLLLFFTLAANNTYSNTTLKRIQIMFAKRPAQSRFNNPENFDFHEKVEMERIVDKLMESATDPYKASLPLLISANLNDRVRYNSSLEKFFSQLKNLQDYPENFEDWMRNNAFRTWMLGRALLAANIMRDANTLARVNDDLSEEKTTPEDNPAFATWTLAYRAALNEIDYNTFKRNMLTGTFKLTEKYHADTTNHGALSDALWAWVMDLSAASAKNYTDYKSVKAGILQLTGKKSIAETLETGLLRTAKSNDYPAWALAKVRLAAAIMQDWTLYDDLAPVVTASIDAAKLANAKAEYALAKTENQLAIKAENQFRIRKLPEPANKKPKTEPAVTNRLN